MRHQKFWDTEKNGLVFAGASRMQGEYPEQKDTTILQHRIADDIFMYAIFSGLGGA